MSTLFRTRLRAADFADRVDGVATASTGGPAAQADLLGLVDDLRVLGEDLRERLMAEAATALEPQPVALFIPEPTRGRERRLVVLATAAVLVGGSAGMAAAAQHALPGQALYPIKRGIEKVDVARAGSPEARGQRLLAQADTRLSEAQALIDSAPSQQSAQVPATLAEFTSQARSGAALLGSSYVRGDDRESISEVRRFATRSQDVLAGLTRTAPLDAQGQLRAAAVAVQQIDAQASTLCASCSSLPPVTLPRALSAAAEADRALDRIDAVGASAVGRLDNSHPVVLDGSEATRVDRPASSGTKRSTQGSGSRSGAGTATGSPPTAASSAVPSPDPSAGPLGTLSGVGKSLTGSASKGSKASTGTRSQATSGTKKKQDPVPSGPLGNVVGTLLPDDATDLLK